MGCSTSRPVTEVETPCFFLIKTISENIHYSRNNLKIFEPTYYLLNIILERVTREKKTSDALCESLRNFQAQLTPLLQENPLNEQNFIKLLLPIQSAFNGLYTMKFDIQTKINDTENISDKLEARFLKEFFLNEPAKFWFNNFGSKDSTSVEAFFERFATTYKDIFEKELQYLPADKKPYEKEIKENIKVLMQYQLESNNDHAITKQGWNVFSFKRMEDFDLRSKFIKDASNVPTNEVHNRIFLNYFYSEGEIIEDPVEYQISDKGLDLSSFTGDKKEKDMKKELISFGRHKENDIEIAKEEISRNHFKISMKKKLKGNDLRNEFFIHNLSKTSYVHFVVEESGYLLGKNMIINISDNKIFFIKDISPAYQPNDSYLTVEPEFLECKRKPPNNNFISIANPFIEIEFYDDGLSKKYEAKSNEEDLTVSIGSGIHDTLQIHDKDDDEDFIYDNHCCLKYNSEKKCWIIQDKTVTQPGNKIFYKTMIRCDNDGQYENYGGGISMRGIKLCNKMKFSLANNVMSVEEKES